MKPTNAWRIGSLVAVLTISVTVFGVYVERKKPAIEKIAVVNGTAIDRKDFNRELNQVQEQVSRQGQQVSDAQLEEVKKEILENLINHEVLYQESRRRGVKVKKEAIATQLASIKKRFSNEAEFEKTLKGMGVSENVIKLKIQQTLAIEELLDTQVARKIVIPEEKSKEFYDTHPEFFRRPEQVKASHILIMVNPAVDEARKTQAKEKIRKVQQRLNNGEDFSALAKEVSEDPSNVNGGDLGYFSYGQMVKAFEEVAFALKVEEISDIVETQFGYHLIKVTDKKPETVSRYEDVKEKISQYLKQERTKQDINHYIDKLRKASKIERFL